jgi:hypothetical protein
MVMLLEKIMSLEYMACQDHVDEDKCTLICATYSNKPYSSLVLRCQEGTQKKHKKMNKKKLVRSEGVMWLNVLVQWVKWSFSTLFILSCSNLPSPFLCMDMSKEKKKKN